MIFDLVGAAAFLAFGAVGFACEGGVTPFPTVMTLRNPRVHTSTSEGGYVSTKVEQMVDESFGLRTIL